MKSRPTYLKVTAVTLAALIAIVAAPRPKHESRSDISPLDDEERQEAEMYTRRSYAKHGITLEVMAGRLTLTHAAALFGALNSLPPRADTLHMEDALPRTFHVPVRTDEERLCRQVVNWVYHNSDGYTQADSAEIIARLEAEYRVELARHGTVKLPEPAMVLAMLARQNSE